MDVVGSPADDMVWKSFDDTISCIVDCDCESSERLDKVSSQELDIVVEAGLKLVTEFSGFRDSLKAMAADGLLQPQACLSFVGISPR